MLMNVLSQYLQNQTTAQATPQQATPQQTTGAGAVQATSVGETVTSGNALYSPSTRAILIGAVAAEFDVTDLTPDDLNRLQDRLQQYGLLNQPDVKVLARLHQQPGRGESQESAGDETSTQNPRINAFEGLNQLHQQQSEQLPYQSRQSLQRVQTLIHNLESANRTFGMTQ
jgi:hypothetical protein